MEMIYLAYLCSCLIAWGVMWKFIDDLMGEDAALFLGIFAALLWPAIALIRFGYWLGRKLG